MNQNGNKNNRGQKTRGRFRVFNKLDILFYSASVCICALFVVLMTSAFGKVDREVLATFGETLPTIVIDAGHGGEDSGAVGVNGILEKDINLSVSMQLADMFRVSGFKVVMVRETDIAVYDEGCTTIREKKVSDLHNRLKLVESQDNCILLSIHQNKFTDSQYSGAQMFYSLKTPQSKELAQYLKESVVSMIQPENKREVKPATKDIYLLYNTNKPAVIVECGFLSNAKEAALLNDDAYQKKMAFAIYCGFMNYWKGTGLISSGDSAG